MTSQQPPYQTSSESSSGNSRKYSIPAVGLTVFAGVMMIMLGAFQLVAGVSALLGDSLYISTRAWLFRFDATRWGGIHLALGILLIAAGMMLFGGMVWARTVAVVFASISALANFA